MGPRRATRPAYQVQFSRSASAVGALANLGLREIFLLSPHGMWVDSGIRIRFFHNSIVSGSRACV